MSLRFSMRTFAIVVTLLPLGLAGVLASHPLASSGVYTLNWVLLCLSLAGAFAVRGEARRFWIGFAVFAWCYWLTVDHQLSGLGRIWRINTATANLETEPLMNPARLLSGHLIDYLENQASPRWNIGDAVTAQYRNGGYYPGVIDDIRVGEYLIRWTDGSSSPPQWTVPSQIQPDTKYSVRVAANSFVCSLWGLVGGVLAAILFYDRRPKLRAVTHEPESPRSSEIAAQDEFIASPS